MYGRLMEERQREHEAHLRTIALLRDVVNGVIPASSVLVSDDAWVIKPPDLTLVETP